MPLITTSIPNLIGGVSQQPPAIRATNEAEVLENGVPSAVEGLLKRAPSEHLAFITDASGAGLVANNTESPFVHLIERDETERYVLVVLKDGTPAVYNLAGVRQTLTVAAGASLGTAFHYQRKALTIGDLTFILNTTQTAAASSTLSTQSPAEPTKNRLIWIKQSNYDRTFLVNIVPVDPLIAATKYQFRTASTGENGTSYVANALFSGALPAATVVSTGIVGSIVNDVLTVTVAGTAPLQIGLEIFSILTGTSGVNGGAPAGSLTQAITGFGVNGSVPSTGGVGTYRLRNVTSSTTKNFTAGANSIQARTPASGGFYTGTGTNTESGIDTAAGYYSGSALYNNTIHVVGSIDFKLGVGDSIGNAGVASFGGAKGTARFEDLPPEAPHNYMIKIEGVPEETSDDYWVKFVAENGTFGPGVWEESLAPGLKYLWDYGTMPLVLIRQSDNTFLLKKADGITGTTGVAAGADYTAFKWEQRYIGDDTTCPFPSFTGSKIQDMVFFQNRLGFLSGENLVFSRVGEFFNFFKESATQLSDSDPIDIASSSPRVGKVMAAVPFNTDLIIFTPTSQLALRSDAVFTPSTVSLVPVGEFENTSSIVKPVPTANSIFFLYNNGAYVGMRELVPQPALSGAYLADELTSRVPQYIKGPVTCLAATSHDTFNVVVSDGDMYGYRYFLSDRQKVQSAWFKFTFNDSSAIAKARPVWVGFVESDLYAIILRPKTSTTSWITLEKIEVGLGTTDVLVSGVDTITFLDQRVYFATSAGNAGVYNTNTKETTFTLPKPLSYSSTLTQVVSSTGYVIPVVSGTVYSGATPSVQATITVQGKWDDQKVWIGTKYSMNYTFSPFYLRDANNSSAFVSGRYQLRYLSIQYAETGYFKVLVSMKNEDPYEYFCTANTVGLMTLGTPQTTSGTFRLPLYSKHDNLTVSVINDSPFPCKLLAAELEAVYETRSARN
jgi:hypothetical protein